MPKLNKKVLGAAVRLRVSVYWDDDKKWYAGKVAQYDEVSNTYMVWYDGGDVNAEHLRDQFVRAGLLLREGQEDGLRAGSYVKSRARSRKREGRARGTRSGTHFGGQSAHRASRGSM